MPKRKPLVVKAADSYAEHGKLWLRNHPVMNEALQEMLRCAFLAGASYAKPKRGEPGSVLKTDEVHLPMAGFQRSVLEGTRETCEGVQRACERTIRGETEHELKDGVDPVELLIDTAKRIGGIDMLFTVDDEAQK